MGVYFLVKGYNRLLGSTVTYLKFNETQVDTINGHFSGLARLMSMMYDVGTGGIEVVRCCWFR